MKGLIAAILLCVSSVCWGATEYLRPTADATQSGVGCTATTNGSSSSMSAVYSGKSGNGPTGSSAKLPSESYSGSSYYSERVFTTWQTGHTESATTLYISANLSTQAGTGSGCIYYSTNSGSTWTLITTNVATTQTTYSVVITGANLANLEVSVSEKAVTSGATVQMTVYDIWTAGTYTASTSHTYTWLLSYLDEQIWRMEYPWRREWM